MLYQSLSLYTDWASNSESNSRSLKSNLEPCMVRNPPTLKSSCSHIFSPCPFDALSAELHFNYRMDYHNTSMEDGSWPGVDPEGWLCIEGRMREYFLLVLTVFFFYIFVAFSGYDGWILVKKIRHFRAYCFKSAACPGHSPIPFSQRELADHLYLQCETY